MNCECASASDSKGYSPSAHSPNRAQSNSDSPTSDGSAVAQSSNCPNSPYFYALGVQSHRLPDSALPTPLRAASATRSAPATPECYPLSPSLCSSQSAPVSCSATRSSPHWRSPSDYAPTSVPVPVPPRHSRPSPRSLYETLSASMAAASKPSSSFALSEPLTDAQ